VERYCDPQLKEAILRIVKQIQRATADSLTRTEWMSPSTRMAAIRKLRHMEIEVAWPTEWPELAGCRLSSTDYIHNLLELAAQESVRNTHLKKCRHPMGDFWPMPVYEVNAYYFPLENRFILPAAILRPPFYDPKRSVPWNYGAIGATIGHEFCHAFDSHGRSYDENGNERGWWTRRDDREYRRRAAGVRRLFESVQYRGHAVDGELTEVENIADIGGLEFALAAAKAELGRSLTIAELREFFTSYAVSWRSKDRLRRAVQLLATDSHAPPMLRVNLIVRQMDAWYEAFGVGPECEGYIPPKKRIRFFGPVPVPVPVPVPRHLQNQ
jgi:endothelin-converting enzyme/putative endopeptidase